MPHFKNSKTTNVPVQSQTWCGDLRFKRYVQWFLMAKNKNIAKIRKQQNLYL
jgi:hypothetical protein